MNCPTRSNSTAALFRWITGHPRLALLLSLVVLILPLQFLPQLVKDTRSDAFLSADNPALIYKDKIQRSFGLNDPIIVALVDSRESGIYRAQTLQLLARLTEQIRALKNINANRVSSLATEQNIRSTAEGIDIRPFLDPMPDSEAELAQLRQAVAQFDIYLGNLVSNDGHMALIAAEMLEESASEETYRELRTLIESNELPDQVELHVAGEGALAGYLGAYIDSDALRLNPLAGLIINLTIFLAFLRVNPALLSNVIIVASVGITLGVMAWAGIAFFVITNALPVILIGMSVADAIHIYSEYYRLRSARPQAPVEDVVLETMNNMWRPITLTTVTTVCGFLGLYLAALMPPFKYFGLFASLGVIIAWLFSLFFLPAALVLTKPRPRGKRDMGEDIFARCANFMGQASLAHPKLTLCIALAVAVAGVGAASNLVVEEDRVDLFHPKEPIYQADKAINRHMDGTNILYIVVEAAEKDGLLEPHILRQIAALQTYTETLPNVGGTVSIVDYLQQIHRVLGDETTAAAFPPASAEAIAQYLFVYSALADPTDFEEEIDYEYRSAIVRVNLTAGSYLSIKPVMEALQQYIDGHFSDGDLKVTLSGRVSLNYHWFKDLGFSHYAGMALALLLVWATTSLLFRSPLAGLFALVPVGGAVLLVYAAMVLLGMTLGIGSSMFAAVAIGLGVDFAIHTLDKLRQLHAAHGGVTHLVYRELFQTTGRALLFNFLAITCGFGVLITSKIVSLNQFGSIVVLAVSTSFIASLTVLPALVKMTKPKFIVAYKDPQPQSGPNPALLGLVFIGLLLILAAVPQPVRADASASASADEIVGNINAAAGSAQVSRRLTITMTDRNGRQRQQSSINYRKQFDDSRKSVMFFDAPANIRGTGFLIWDYDDAQATDDQWLYLPSLRKARRVSASDRGSYFLGTDFTYEDMKLDGKMEPRDYTFSLLREEDLAGVNVFVLEAVAKSAELAEELGYSRTLSWVDPGNWVLRKAEFYDPRGELLKTLTADEIRQVDGVWTRHELLVVNHQTGHSTRFDFTDVDYLTPVENELFSKQTLARGP